MPSSAAFLARNLCGVCTRMPAPSPARGSAPTAPRCSRLSRIVNASSTIWCDLRPFMSAINPTPQESFSSAGSNRPKPDAFIVLLAILPAPPPMRHRAPTIHLFAPSSHPRARQMGRTELAPRGESHFLEATFVPLMRPLVACSCRRPARPRHQRLTPCVSSDFPTALRGSPIGTAMLSYIEHGKFFNPTQAPTPYLSLPA